MYICFDNAKYVLTYIIVQIEYAELQQLLASGKICTTPNDTFTPYAEIC